MRSKTTTGSIRQAESCRKTPSRLRGFFRRGDVYFCTELEARAFRADFSVAETEKSAQATWLHGRVAEGVDHQADVGPEGIEDGAGTAGGAVFGHLLHALGRRPRGTDHLDDVVRHQS